jgi:hypothetical protein
MNLARAGTPWEGRGDRADDDRNAASQPLAGQIKTSK